MAAALGVARPVGMSGRCSLLAAVAAACRAIYRGEGVATRDVRAACLVRTYLRTSNDTNFQPISASQMTALRNMQSSAGPISPIHQLHYPYTPISTSGAALSSKRRAGDRLQPRATNGGRSQNSKGGKHESNTIRIFATEAELHMLVASCLEFHGWIPSRSNVFSSGVDIFLSQGPGLWEVKLSRADLKFAFDQIIGRDPARGRPRALAEENPRIAGHYVVVDQTIMMIWDLAKNPNPDFDHPDYVIPWRLAGVPEGQFPPDLVQMLGQLMPDKRIDLTPGGVINTASFAEFLKEAMAGESADKAANLAGFVQASGQDAGAEQDLLKRYRASKPGMLRAHVMKEFYSVRGKGQKAAEGLYTTPTAVVDLAIKMVLATLEGISGDLVFLDLSCGAGSFVAQLDAMGSSQYRVVAGDLDPTAASFTELMFGDKPNVKVLRLNSLGPEVTRAKLGISDRDKLVVITNPPFSDNGSRNKRYGNLDKLVDLSSTTKDLGVAFMTKYVELQPDIICTVLSFKYLTNKNKFKDLQVLHRSYQLAQAAVVPRKWFDSQGKDFPIVCAVYKRKANQAAPTTMAAALDASLNFKYQVYGHQTAVGDSLGEPIGTFQPTSVTKNGLQDIDAYGIRKYPPRKGDPRTSDLDLAQYNLRDLNSLLTSGNLFAATSTSGKSDSFKNSLPVNADNLHQYAYLNCMKQCWSQQTPAHLLLANESPLLRLSNTTITAADGEPKSLADFEAMQWLQDIFTMAAIAFNAGREGFPLHPDRATSALHELVGNIRARAKDWSDPEAAAQNLDLLPADLEIRQYCSSGRRPELARQVKDMYQEFEAFWTNPSAQAGGAAGDAVGPAADDSEDAAPTSTAANTTSKRSSSSSSSSRSKASNSKKSKTTSKSSRTGASGSEAKEEAVRGHMDGFRNFLKNYFVQLQAQAWPEGHR